MSLKKGYSLPVFFTSNSTPIQQSLPTFKKLREAKYCERNKVLKDHF